MKTIILSGIFVLCLLTVIACGSKPTSTVDVPATITAGMGSAEKTADAKAEIQRQATRTAAAQSTQEAQAAITRQTQTAQAALDQAVAATAAKKSTQQSRAAASKATTDAFKAGLAGNFSATQTAEMAIVAPTATAWRRFISDQSARLVELGYLDELFRKDAVVIPLLDFEQNWAQRNWYQSYSVEPSTGETQDYIYLLSMLGERMDWVLFGDLSWLMEDKNANHTNSGCGVMFALKDNDNYNMVYLSLDGNAYLGQLKNASWNDLDSWVYGKPGLPSGGAKFALLIVGERIVLLVDGEIVIDTVQNFQAPGTIAWTLSSGTNKGKGMQCKISNPELVVLKPDS